MAGSVPGGDGGTGDWMVGSGPGHDGGSEGGRVFSGVVAGRRAGHPGDGPVGRSRTAGSSPGRDRRVRVRMVGSGADHGDGRGRIGVTRRGMLGARVVRLGSVGGARGEQPRQAMHLAAELGLMAEERGELGNAGEQPRQAGIGPQAPGRAMRLDGGQPRLEAIAAGELPEGDGETLDEQGLARGRRPIFGAQAGE